MNKPVSPAHVAGLFFKTYKVCSLALCDGKPYCVLIKITPAHKHYKLLPTYKVCSFALCDGKPYSVLIKWPTQTL